MDAGALKELRTLRKPPTPVLQTVQATMFLLGHPQEEVKDSRYVTRFMGQKDLDKTLAEFDASKVTPEQASLAKETIAGLTIEIVRNASRATECLFAWVQNSLQKCGAA